jgi:hypothetical protein
LVDCLGKGVVLEVSHSFGQWARTFGRHFIPEEGDLGRAEDALHQVNDDPILVKAAEESP